MVYNFTVAKDHDYFVGETGFLVHNAGSCGCKLQAIEFPPEVLNPRTVPPTTHGESLNTLQPEAIQEDRQAFLEAAGLTPRESSGWFNHHIGYNPEPT